MQKTITRREMLRLSGAVLGGSLLGGFPAKPGGSQRSHRYSAAVIGRTGEGDYGHGLDTIFNDIENVDVVAVADIDEAGARKAADRSGAETIYADYRMMLQKEQPDLVSIAMRHPWWHREITLEAIDVGAHIYMDKPFTETLTEADSIIQSARERSIKIGVAHHRRYMREFLALKQLLQDGLVGEVLEIRSYGKQDRRVGGEDLIVLGTHDLDYMRYLFGDPLWCSASVTVGGQDIRPADVHEGYEPYLVAGDTVRARYAFSENIHGYWSSVKTGDHWNNSAEVEGDLLEDRQKWGFDIFGTEGIIYYRAEDGIRVLPSPYPDPGVEHIGWRELPADGISVPDHQTHPIRSLLHAIETGGEPQCSGTDGRWAVEMVSAVYQSQIQGKRVAFPLDNRSHPLREFT